MASPAELALRQKTDDLDGSEGAASDCESQFTFEMEITSPCLSLVSNGSNSSGISCARSWWIISFEISQPLVIAVLFVGAAKSCPQRLKVTDRKGRICILQLSVVKLSIDEIQESRGLMF